MDKKEAIISSLKQVYDPEFPIVDIYTLGLIYRIDIHEELAQVDLVMTFTTPSCPLADTIKEMVRNAVLNVLPDYVVEIEVSFDPMWNIDMVKDPDVKRMFL
ncbi:MAG: DUF59 domain-containing protein [bacterium]|nr:DUF59 domain-containing protein [bacterium]